MNDPRVTPARPDVAAAFLKGKVEAARFAEGVRKTVIPGRTPLHAAPTAQSMRDTELLRGESFVVYDMKDGWSWGQAARDGYVGYTPAAALADPEGAADHRVIALSTPLLHAPSLETWSTDMLPMNARVRVTGREPKCLAIAGGGFVYEKHIAPLAYRATDWVAVAERFLGVPYVWGGRTFSGLDCSGLIQTALEAGGLGVPRDSDQQEAFLPNPVTVDDDLRGLQRGDIVFWPEHVGVLIDPTYLLHANGHFGETAIEPLRDVVVRTAARGKRITSIRRL